MLLHRVSLHTYYLTHAIQLHCLTGSETRTAALNQQQHQRPKQEGIYTALVVCIFKVN